MSNLRKLEIESVSDEVGKILSDQIFAFLQEQPQMTEMLIDMPQIWIRHDEDPIELNQGRIFMQEKLDFIDKPDLFESEASLNKVLLLITRQ